MGQPSIPSAPALPVSMAPQSVEDRLQHQATPDSGSSISYCSSGMADGEDKTSKVIEIQLPPTPKPPKPGFLAFARFFGSGLLIAVSYLDPGNLEADIQLGVKSGMRLLWWTAICCLVFGFMYQCISARLGLVTGKDLAALLGERYPTAARYLLWILVEVAIVGADIQEVVGSAIALSILTSGRLPLYGGCIVGSLSAFTLLFIERLGFRHLETVFGMLIGVVAVAMGINFVQADIPSREVALGFVPTLPRSSVPQAVALLGALVMPYNIFLQSAVINGRHRGAVDSDDRKANMLKFIRIENFLVLLLAFIINLFVICVFAHGFYTSDSTPPEVGLKSAGDYLAEQYGPAFRIVWAIGLLASGQVASITLTYSGQILMAGLLKIKVHAGARMLATRLVSLVPTLTLAAVFEASNTFDRVAQLLNIVQSLVLPFALAAVLRVCAESALMGRFVSHPALTAFGALTAAAVTGINVYLVITFIQGSVEEKSPGTQAGCALFVAVYLLLVLYFTVGPDRIPPLWQRVTQRVSGRVTTTCKEPPPGQPSSPPASDMEVH